MPLGPRAAVLLGCRVTFKVVFAGHKSFQVSAFLFTNRREKNKYVPPWAENMWSSKDRYYGMAMGVCRVGPGPGNLPLE